MQHIRITDHSHISGELFYFKLSEYNKYEVLKYHVHCDPNDRVQ